MLRSLLIKLSLLALTASLVFWIGWPVPEQRPGGSGGQVLSKGGAEPRLPSRDQSEPRGASVRRDPAQRIVTAETKPNSLLDLNRATLEELVALPGLGPTLAQRILDQRRQKGAFVSVDELLEVRGIGEKRLAALRGQLVVLNRQVEHEGGSRGAEPSVRHKRERGPAS